MSKLLLNMRMVPEDEAEDVRAMLREATLEFYETQPSRWGISYGGIWLANDDDLARAKRLMADYQGARSARARAERADQLRDGSAETFADVCRREPLRVVLSVLGILAMLALLALVPLLLRNP
ncbi:MAG: DUF6164 family protein [Luteimonas sp.]